MTHIEVTEYNNETAIEISGHTGFAKVGSDIVCAGISALTMALDAFAVKSSVQLGDGWYYALFKKKNAQAVKMFTAGVRAIEELYPDCVEISC